MTREPPDYKENMQGSYFFETGKSTFIRRYCMGCMIFQKVEKKNCKPSLFANCKVYRIISKKQWMKNRERGTCVFKKEREEKILLLSLQFGIIEIS
jgi:hypothetical protein